ncbi:hypothetical protein BDR05DRAFT_1001799 [Suillus weaverae]|nr:hypothetical protein BDR05DRAFT_1001799 [Suillus weaverae]
MRAAHSMQEYKQDSTFDDDLYCRPASVSTLAQSRLPYLQPARKQQKAHPEPYTSANHRVHFVQPMPSSSITCLQQHQAALGPNPSQNGSAPATPSLYYHAPPTQSSTSCIQSQAAPSPTLCGDPAAAPGLNEGLTMMFDEKFINMKAYTVWLAEEEPHCDTLVNIQELICIYMKLKLDDTLLSVLLISISITLCFAERASPQNSTSTIMSISGIYNLDSVASKFLNPRHKMLPNQILSCSLNSNIVIKLINNPLLIPRSLWSTGNFDKLISCQCTKVWVFKDSVIPSELLTPTHGHNGWITSSFLKNIEATMEDMIFWLNIVFDAYGSSSVDLNLSQVDSLSVFQGSYKEISTELWKLRRSVLIAWGYIIYLLLNVAKDWKHYASCTPEFIQNITSSAMYD